MPEDNIKGNFLPTELKVIASKEAEDEANKDLEAPKLTAEDEKSKLAKLISGAS